MTTIAVTGASGQLGRLVVERLLARGVRAEDVVAVVRDPTKAAALKVGGVDVRVGDYSDPATLPTALEGVEVLLLISGHGRFLAGHVAVIDAAKEAGVRRVVYTSTLRAGRHQAAGASEHLGTEEHLRSSGLEYTILRNGQYIENYISRTPQILAQGEIVGATADHPVAAAVRTDYADAAAAVLVGDGHAGQTYELGGTPFTVAELAATITDITGITVVYRDLSSDELLAVLKANGMPEAFAPFAVQLDEATAAGAHYTDSGDLQRLLGRPSTSLADAVHAAAQQLRVE
jgi:NAD(P)H dehydrogenase (quinone)